MAEYKFKDEWEVAVLPYSVRPLFLPPTRFPDAVAVGQVRWKDLKRKGMFEFEIVALQVDQGGLLVPVVLIPPWRRVE